MSRDFTSENASQLGPGNRAFCLYASRCQEVYPIRSTAKAVTTRGAISEAETQLTPGLMQFWNAILPGQIVEQLAVPDAFDGNVIDMEGHALSIITVGQSERASRPLSTFRAWRRSSQAMLLATVSPVASANRQPQPAMDSVAARACRSDDGSL
jgi:hypothetical protein